MLIFKKSLLTLLMMLCVSGAAICQTPLTPEEKRLIVGQLVELSSCRKVVAAHEQFQRDQQALYEREKAFWERSIELEKQAVEVTKKEMAVTQRELALANQQLEFYRTSLHTVIKGKGIGYKLCKVFTLGIARCQ